MKVWAGYGSEHSMNLVLIGTFKNARGAEMAEKLIADLVAATQADDPGATVRPLDAVNVRFSKALMAVIDKHEFYTLAPPDLELLGTYDSLDRKKNVISIRTDEADISALLKVLLHGGAKVQVYSRADGWDDETPAAT